MEAEAEMDVEADVEVGVEADADDVDDTDATDEEGTEALDVDDRDSSSWASVVMLLKIAVPFHATEQYAVSK